MFKSTVFLVLIIITPIAFSAIDVYDFDNIHNEERFKKLTYELRCPKCQNQSIADSGSDLSLDLKQIVYEKIKLGESDQAILNFMKQRYGEFILFNPELNQSNLFLWLAPFVFIVLFVVIFLIWYKNNRAKNND